jgi:hypothetical protein
VLLVLEHRCPFPIGWLIEGFEEPPKKQQQQVNDDRWYTKPAALFLPKRTFLYIFGVRWI